MRECGGGLQGGLDDEMINRVVQRWHEKAPEDSKPVACLLIDAMSIRKGITYDVSGPTQNFSQCASRPWPRCRRQRES